MGFLSAQFPSKSLSAVLLLSALVLTSCRVLPVDEEVFACQADDDCGDGYECVQHYCRSSEDVENGLFDECGGRCSAERKVCCGAECVDSQRDPSHCGGCGILCEEGENCFEGLCRTETSFDGSCENGIDDDGDGLVDCEDVLDCPQGTPCRTGVCCEGACRNEGRDGSCSNGIDDDCDGLIDCDDPDCNGRPCADGRVCRTFQCVSACFIGGRYIPPGDPHPDHPCMECRPELDTHGWSPVDRLVPCGTGLRCDGDGVCRGAEGTSCAGPGDCATGHCVNGSCAM